MMKITQNLLLFSYYSSLFIFLIHFPQTSCSLNPTHNCNPSSCGNIHNISFPFRLKHDPKHCGHPRYELECENNVTTILYLYSQKYKVKAIHYANDIIWLSDVSVKNNSICSFPKVSLTSYFLSGSNYGTLGFNLSSGYMDDTETAMPINLMRCPYPYPYRLNNSSSNSLFFTELPSHCNNNSATVHTYIKIGSMHASDVGENCSVGPITLTSWKFKDLKNVSISEIHDSLLYGFRLSWGYYECISCYGRQVCPRYYGHIVSCSRGVGPMLGIFWDLINHPNYGHEGSGPLPAVVIILLLILGVGLAAMIILGITCVSGFIFIETTRQIHRLNVYWPFAHLRLIFGLFFAVRFIIVFPFIARFLIYKFRRRHLSRYDAIEDFLQSENNLMPIRYSYSDLKKITRGFREKLGQGGYGTVYKGKLRSGYDVAVKLLGKPGGNGQDFMNEISTIGRIHHVNVVKLVGYCAERSKRALVFDFMPNGSLDKYICGQENTNCLSWERKYEIAVGVARGIEYLHRGCDIQILHFDIKPHNILLDDGFNPKITDFGLAKFFSPEKQVVTMTAIRGTIGYVAPELINRGFGEVSYKADVYSFGMLLTEMIGLNKESRRNNQASTQYFPDWIYDSIEEGRDIEIGVTEENNNDDNNDTNREIAKKMTIVALWCIQTCPGDRPSMNKVVEMLEAKVERLRVPNRPSESAQVAVYDEDQSWSTYSTDTISLLPRNAASTFEITIED